MKNVLWGFILILSFSCTGEKVEEKAGEEFITADYAHMIAVELLNSYLSAISSGICDRDSVEKVFADGDVRCKVKGASVYLDVYNNYLIQKHNLCQQGVIPKEECGK